MTVSFFDGGVTAGFPSSADDYLEKKLDLNALLIKHPSATFFVRVEGDSMMGVGIYSQDILVVDRAEPFVSGKVMVVLYNGAFAVKKFVKENSKIILYSAHPSFSPIYVTEGDDFQIWGVVTYVIHRPC